jgi:uroporphyrinogen-III synthase
LLIVEGQNNRPTLGDGLRARGAEVIAVGFYARHDRDWESTIWDRFKQYAHSELAVIVTSTGVIDRLLGQCRARGIDPTQLLWCTQHPTIAARLRQAGCEQLRRVRLDPQFLTGDLFDHEFGW